MDFAKHVLNALEIVAPSNVMLEKQAFHGVAKTF